MSKRETSKIIEIGNRKFKVEKFDALTGSYIAFTIASKIMPLIKGDGLYMDDLQKALLGGELLSRQEFTKLQKDCLSVVSEILPAGARPILNDNGSWGVMDIDKDTMLVVMLTIHALVFNVMGFFGEGNLSALKAGLADLIPANMQMSMDTPMGR